jgi:O-antigen/teichoic acid export membrane protein
VNRLGFNTILLTGSSMATQALTAVTYWLVARALLPSEFGALSAAIGVATLLLTALDFGINSLTIRHLARQPDDIEAFTSTLSAKVATSCTVGLAWMAVTLAVAIREPAWGPFVLLGLYIALSDIASTLTVVARSRERMYVAAIVAFVQKASGLLVTALALLFLSNGSYALPLGFAIGGVVSVLVARMFLEDRFLVGTRISLSGIVDLWRSSAGFGLSGFAAQIQRVDVTIVAAIAGSTAAGFFAAPARVTNLLSVLPTALSAALFPRVARTSDARAARDEALKAIGITTLLSTFVMAVLFVLAEPLVPFVLGEEYAASVPVLRAFLVGLVFMSANAPLAALLQAEGREMYVAKVIGAASILGLGCVGVGAALDGATGAAAGYILLQLAILIPLLSCIWLERTSLAESGSY